MQYSQGYRVTTVADLWEYTSRPASERISLRRRTLCGRLECENKLDPPREVGAPVKRTGRVVCRKCRDILYCSQACARSDSKRHAIECAANAPDILKCTINEDTAGVVVLLRRDPTLASKTFGGHAILEWAQRVGHEPTVRAIEAVLEETKKLDESMAQLSLEAHLQKNIDELKEMSSQVLAVGADTTLKVVRTD